MKKITIICFSIALGFQSYAQTCSRTVNSWVKAPGGYNINGVATLTNSNGDITISLDNNFSTVSGPDLHIYLATENKAPTESGNKTIEISPLNSNTGAQSFTLPNNNNINEYNYVLIHCKLGQHFWGGGALNNPVGTCPSVAGIEDFGLPSQDFYYKDSDKELIISSNTKNYKLLIYNILGNIISSNSLNLTHLKSGIYFAYLQIENQETKLLKFSVK